MVCPWHNKHASLFAAHRSPTLIGLVPSQSKTKTYWYLWSRWNSYWSNLCFVHACPSFCIQPSRILMQGHKAVAFIWVQTIFPHDCSEYMHTLYIKPERGWNFFLFSQSYSFPTLDNLCSFSLQPLPLPAPPLPLVVSSCPYPTYLFGYISKML